MNFKDFLLKENKEDFQLPSLQESKNNLSLGISTLLIGEVTSVFGGGVTEEDFAKNISETVHSEEFIDELSDKIKTPKENESEEQFVERAKKAMKDILYKKFNIK